MDYVALVTAIPVLLWLLVIVSMIVLIVIKPHLWGYTTSVILMTGALTIGFMSLLLLSKAEQAHRFGYVGLWILGTVITGLLLGLLVSNIKKTGLREGATWGIAGTGLVVIGIMVALLIKKPHLAGYAVLGILGNGSLVSMALVIIGSRSAKTQQKTRST